jgi:hypothetical protein
MPDEKPRWGTQAIREAEIRHTEKTVSTTINPGSGTKLLLKLDKTRDTAYINGHPFMNSDFAIAEIARKFAQLRQERERANAARLRNGGEELANS